MSAEYNFRETEQKWQQFWEENQTYRTEIDQTKPKYYVLDMFPYPSGAGLHVGHPLGYIASDIVSRYKRLKGFNVLHPMGFDSFGLPAEQYAIQTGQHPAITTQENIATFISQLKNIGFSYDWSREVRTSDPNYYKWTQWIFMQLFDHYYDRVADKALKISQLVAHFAENGNKAISAVCDEDTPSFTAAEWNAMSEPEQQKMLLKYRLTFPEESFVNWCPGLGTVLSNDEVKDGVSERGGYPVERKLMKQWSMRITAYADRLINGLDEVDWPESLKEQQRNWIGRSVGASVKFSILDSPSQQEKGLGDEVVQANFITTDYSTWKHLKPLARENRKNQTEAESLLWEELRGQKIEFKFRRQHAIGDYIVDFVNIDTKLIVEVDGKIHEEGDNPEYDAYRTLLLNEAGFRVIRFKNEDIITNMEGVLAEIKHHLNLTPNPFPTERGAIQTQSIEVFTTRVDTIYGVSFMVLAPEHEWVEMLTTPEQKAEVEAYIKWAASRSEIDRMAEVKKVTGAFTGSYCINPFNNEKVPIYLADYVLAGYGTGAVMGVPSGDQRDWNFATHFGLPIVPILDAQKDIDKQADNTKDGRYINSGIINGMTYAEGTQTLIDWLEERGLGKGKVQYRLRNAVFSRQRYWGEPVPVYYKDGIPYLIDESDLPLELPAVDKYLPTETGEPPLGRAEGWKYTPSQQEKGLGDEVAYDYELSTMPGWAGSSWYWYRYMDAQNNQEFASQEAINYWKAVDLYLGGSEHATGHLLYSRFWNKFLKDLGLVPEEEFAKKLINQGMIQGRSSFVYRLKSSEGEGKTPVFVSFGLKDQYETTPLHVDVNIVENDVLDIEAFKQWRSDFENAEFILESGGYRCGWEVEKMSKRYYNVVNPDDVVARYGADTLRLYEMFLGPLTDSKPWSTSGISGTFNFLRKFWRLFHDEAGNLKVTDSTPSPNELKVLHKAIKRVEEDIERYSFNTVVSTFMITVNELTDLKCRSRAILQDLVVLLSPYAPHVCEELWAKLGNTNGTISAAQYPVFNPVYIAESSFEYPVQINGKVRVNISFSVDTPASEIEKEVLANATVQKWLEGKPAKKVVVVPKRIVNVVV